MERRSKGKKVLLVILFLLVCVLVVWLLKSILKEPEEKWDDSLSQSAINQITYDGKQYSYNGSLINLLFIGIDNSAGIRDDNMPSDAGQADCLILLTLDKEKKEARILQIPRDTMTEVDVYNVGGNIFKTLQAQIATQYADFDGNATNDIRFNPNDSAGAVEGITSPDGRVFGKMGHSERIGNGLYRNVPGNYDIRMFESAVRYFKS